MLTPYQAERGVTQETKAHQAGEGHSQTIKCRGWV